jgi:hypothetical protein
MRIEFSALTLALLFATADAFACGGTFCDSPPPGRPPMPVEQTGENVVFVMSQGFVEAHVQIQYNGDPARFAWLVPVPAVPELSVGSDQLFLNLLNGSVPTFNVSNSTDSCSGGRSQTSSGGGCGAGSLGESASFDGTGVGSEPRSHSDVVVGTESVGAFDVTVLQAANADEVSAWLATNGFLNAPEAPSLLQDYIDRGHVFVAVKLQPGAGVNEIHPLVIRYQGNEPCIPLKLTRVAATADMGVRAFFLGDQRVAPVSYLEVSLNPARLDWVDVGSNYNSMVSLAVDSPGADGHAFVTEYAGSSSVVASDGLFDTRWNSDAFRTAQPEKVFDLLGAQGLVTCKSGSACVTNHPLLLPIVRKYLPAPPGVSEQTFYGCLSCNASSIDRTAWDGNGFADDLDERVVVPGRHAADILATSPFLTRLFTTISPEEMTDDPTFVNTQAASTVSDKWSGNINTTCNGEQAAEAPGLPPIALDGGGQMPTFDQKMPYTAKIRVFDTAGNGSVIFDNSKVINEQIRSWNDSQGFPGASVSRSSSSSSSGACSVVLGVCGANPAHTFALLGALALARRLRRKGRGRFLTST